MEPEQQAEWYAGSGYLPVSTSAFELPRAKEMEANYPQFRIAAQLYLAASSRPDPWALFLALSSMSTTAYSASKRCW